MRRSRTWHVVAALMIATLTAPSAPEGAHAGASNASIPADAPPIAPPGWFRPVVNEGKVFPVARSNYLSLLYFPNNWHALRLRLVGGKWLPIGRHEGIDITAEPGTPVVAMAGGVVDEAGYLFYSGLRVWLAGSDGRHYLYAHLSSLAPGIAPGARVRAGQLLGSMGNTGYGPPRHRDEFPAHLHLGIYVGGEAVNPYPELVSLYSAAVRANHRDQAALERLAELRKHRVWERRLAKVFTSFGR